MYASTRNFHIKGNVDPKGIMYNSSRLMPINQEDSKGKQDIVERLTGIEGKLDEAIALKRLNSVESRVDAMLNQLGIKPDTPLSRLNKMDAKLDTMLGQLETAKPTVVTPKPKPIPLKKITAAKLSGKATKGLDLVFQVSPKAQPLLILGVIKSLQLAGLNTIVRLHHHSSIINIDNDAFLFRSLLTAFQITLDKSVSRKVADHDFVFTFILTNRLEGHDIDLTAASSTYTPIFSDKTCAKLVWKLAGGECSAQNCDFWLDRVDVALTDAKQTESVKKQISKQFNKSNGLLGDVAVSVLV